MSPLQRVQQFRVIDPGMERKCGATPRVKRTSWICFEFTGFFAQGVR